MAAHTRVLLLTAEPKSPRGPGGFSRGLVPYVIIRCSRWDLTLTCYGSVGTERGHRL
jgi:hypothetical protein